MPHNAGVVLSLEVESHRTRVKLTRELSQVCVALGETEQKWSGTQLQAAVSTCDGLGEHGAPHSGFSRRVGERPYFTSSEVLVARTVDVTGVPRQAAPPSSLKAPSDPAPRGRPDHVALCELRLHGWHSSPKGVCEVQESGVAQVMALLCFRV